MGRYNNGYESIFRNREQQYNDPMSMYVDPRLDLLANAAGSLQKRHEENYANMSALDIAAANMKVAEGDAAIKQGAVNELKGQLKAISEKGDYALAAPRIGMATKGLLTNENLIAAQDNFKSIQEYEKRRQELGASALDFNPASNWSTVDPVTQKPRRFVADMEARKDWDARAQSVTKLVADAQNIPLGDAGVRGYLSSGSISGISDAKVRAYADNASRRFMQSEEGAQMYRALTKGANGATPMTDDQARGEIARFMYDVGSAQIHKKTDINYQVNQPMMQEDSQAFQASQQEDAQAHDKEMEDLRYKKAMDLEKAKEEAKKKAEALVLSPAATFELAASTPNADKSFGTQMTTGDLVARGLDKTTITDPETGNKMEAVMVPMAIGTFGSKITPETGAFAHKEVEMAQQYFGKKKAIEDLRGQIKSLRTAANLPTTGLSKSISQENAMEVKRIESEIERLEKGYNEADLYKLEEAGRITGKTNAQIQAEKQEYVATKRKEGLLGLTPKQVEIAQKYKTAYEGDNINIAKSVGQKLNGKRVAAVVDNTNGPSAFRVDGGIHGKFVAKMTGSELTSTLSNEEIAWMKKTGQINSDENHFVFGDGLTDSKVYDVHFASPIPSSAGINTSYNNAKAGVTTASKNMTSYAVTEAETAQRLQNRDKKMSGLVSNIPVPIDPNSAPVPYREAIRMQVYHAIDTDPNFKPEEKAATKRQVDTFIDGFDNLDEQQKVEFIDYLQENGI